jgi:hypothetical protein
MTPADDATPTLLSQKPDPADQPDLHASPPAADGPPCHCGCVWLSLPVAGGARGVRAGQPGEPGPPHRDGPQRRRGPINELAVQKLAERATDQNDRRRNIVTITAKGRAHLRRLDSLLADAQEELLTPLSPGEREALVDMPTRLLDYHTG